MNEVKIRPEYSADVFLPWAAPEHRKVRKTVIEWIRKLILYWILAFASMTERSGSTASMKK